MVSCFSYKSNQFNLENEHVLQIFENGLCILHDKGLKPTEGRLSHHTVRKDNFNPAMSIAWNVAKEWLMPENEDVLSRVVNKFLNARKP